jgi:hypothetical protein
VLLGFRFSWAAAVEVRRIAAMKLSAGTFVMLFMTYLPDVVELAVYGIVVIELLEGLGVSRVGDLLFFRACNSTRALSQVGALNARSENKKNRILKKKKHFKIPPLIELTHLLLISLGFSRFVEKALDTSKMRCFPSDI